ncbi:Ig-like domain-containing protein [Azonexus hydrophilus]
MVEAKVWISSGFKAGDVLDASSLPSGWLKNYNAATGELTLSGSATDIANVLAALQTVTYVSTSDDPGNADRTISWQVKDANSEAASNGQLNTNTVTTTVHVTPVNDPPVATPNTNSVTEDSGTPTTGNVKTDGTPDSDPDNVMSTVPVTSITATTAGGSATTVADNAGAGTVVTGKYGTLTIHPDGSYSYALDNTNPDVNALTDSGTLTEVFNYTIKDPGDLTASSTLTITINGYTDGAPTINPVDGNAGVTGEATVHESGLNGGSEAATSKETTTGSITLTTPDGLKEVTIGGTTFTVAQLQVLSVGSPSAAIDTGKGELRITGITNKVGPAGGPTSAELTYSYTLKAAQTHTGATESTDVVTLQVKDVNNVTGSGNLTIQIVDDVPVATADTGNVKATETLTVIAANGVLNNDKSGADGWAAGGSVVGVAKGSGGAPTTGVNTDIAGDYGTLKLQADGSYTYVANVAAPGADPTTTDVFTYTVRDADGDETTAILTITIQNNQPPVANNDTRTTPEDTPVSGNVLNGSGGDVADTDPDSDPLTVTQIVINGITTPVPVDGSTVSVDIPGCGTLVINNTGAYTFAPVSDWHGTVPDITYTINDGKGATNSEDTAVLKITVTPVVDIADDKISTPAGNPVKTPVLGNDSFENTDAKVTGVTPPAHGKVTINPDGSITYYPDPGFSGEDSYTYTVTSGGVTETATVRVTVMPENPPPLTPPSVDERPYSPLAGPDPVKPPVLTQASPVILDAGPYFANERFDDVRRLPLPFHPIVYVNREVASSQAQRAQDDPRGFSDPSAAVPGERPPVSLGAGLGQDPNLFVSHAIRDSQSVASFLRSTVEGRYSRLGLGSDGYLASPGLFSQPATEISELLKEQRKKLKKAAGEASAAVAENGQGDAPATQPQIARAAGQPDRAAARASGGVAAPSFNEQLRSGAARLPMAARKV